MHTHLALLRGINVSGHNIIKMEDLRKLLEASGFSNVRTYIQSGNIIFESAEKSKTIVSGQIKKAILDKYGFDVSAIMLNAGDLAKAIKNNPFVKEKDIDRKQIYLVYLSAIPTDENISNIDLHQFAPDVFEIIGKIIYIKFSESASNSKLTNNFLQKKLQVDATTRNWNTTLKLMALLDDS